MSAVHNPHHDNLNITIQIIGSNHTFVSLSVCYQASGLIIRVYMHNLFLIHITTTHYYPRSYQHIPKCQYSEGALLGLT